MNPLLLSWKNLTSKPLSTVLSLLLFALGVGLISLVFLLDKQLDQQFRKNMEGIDMVIGAKGSPLQLVLSSIFHLDAPTGNIRIDDAKAFLNPRHPLIETAIPLSLGDSYRGYRIVGTQHKIVAHYNARPAKGKLWDHSMEVTLGANVADREGLTIGDTFKSTHGLDENEDLVHGDAASFKVVGILEPTGAVVDQLILTAPESVWEVHGEHEEPAATDTTALPAADSHEGHGQHAQDDTPLYEKTGQDITAILVKFKARNVQTLNMPRMINENTNLLAANPAYEISKLFAQLGRGEKVLRILGIVIVVVSSFSIFISLYSSLKDRRYELAIMRTLGASPGRLFSLIIIEGIILAVLGYLLGIFFSHAGLEIGAQVADDAYRYPFTGWDFLQRELWLLAGALVIGFVAAFIPALEARNTDIHDTLAEG